MAKTVGGVTTRYLVDDLNPTGYAQVVEEVVNGQVRRQYTWGNTLISQRQLLNGVWTASFYGVDGHGNVRMLTDTGGTITDTFDYDAFSNLVSRLGSTPNNYLYSGEQFDPDLGIYFQRARYYNQQRGRFLSMDLFAGILDEPDTLRKYLYVGNDPVNLTDPSGEAEFSEYLQRVKQQVRDTIVYAQTRQSHPVPDYQDCVNHSKYSVFGVGLSKACTDGCRIWITMVSLQNSASESVS